MICSSFAETRIELFLAFTSISVAAFFTPMPSVGLRLIGVFVLSDVSYAPGYFLLLSPAFYVDFYYPIGRRPYENFETPFLHFFDSARKELISYFSSSSSSLFFLSSSSSFSLTYKSFWNSTLVSSSSFTVFFFLC